MCCADQPCSIKAMNGPTTSRALVFLSIMIGCRSTMAVNFSRRYGKHHPARSGSFDAAIRWRSSFSRNGLVSSSCQRNPSSISAPSIFLFHTFSNFLHWPPREVRYDLYCNHRRCGSAERRSHFVCQAPGRTFSSSGRRPLQRKRNSKRQWRTRQQSSLFHFWLRGGGASSDDAETVATTDLSQKRGPYIKSWCNGDYPVTVCSVQGWRDYMEDEFVTAHDFAAVFDGHGGKAISRYLRQNLYANLQAALPMVMGSRPELPEESNNTGGVCKSNSSVHPDDEALAHVDAATTVPWNTTSPAGVFKGAAPAFPTVQDYETALEIALDKVDREVQRISHWSFQGSTALAVWLHVEGENNPSIDGRTSETETKNLTSNAPTAVRTLITANVGDSRAVLARGGTAVLELSRDHKPNDPIERSRIHRLGGRVVWHGPVDAHGDPIEGTGLYRVNGNLALSRAVGDRSERPAVTADPEFSVVPLQEDDEFLVLATDGLWDVMSSEDAVSYIRALLENAVDDDSIDRDTIAGLVVEEALRRGSYDNITVIIVWFHVERAANRPKKYWI